MTKLLGIDYGSKRIGIAMSDEMGQYALPYSVVENSKSAVEDVLKICKENNVTKIVMGESKDFGGKDNSIMTGIRKFVDELGEKSKIEIVLQPEFLTSFQAERTNYDLRGSKDMLDASAAAIILQSYLDSNNQ